MRVFASLKYMAVLAAAIIMFSSCEEAKTKFTGSAHLKITNLDTGETAENYAAITLGGSEYDLVVSRGQTLEIEFLPQVISIGDEIILGDDFVYTVDFELFDTKKTLTQSPYKFEYTVGDDVTDGIYEVKCSAMTSRWTDDSSYTQTMKLLVQ